MPSMNAFDAMFSSRSLAAALAAACATLLSACGSGGGDTPPGSPVGSVSNQYAQQCSPNNPYRQDSDAGPNPTPGTLAIEKQWAREYLNEAYLWYAQMPSVDANAAAYSSDTGAGLYPSLSAYFVALTTTPDDRFSLIYPTRAWKQLSQAGISVSYGAEFAQVGAAGATAYRIAYVEPGSPAATAGLRRGDTVAAIDGQPVASLSADVIDAALLPSAPVSHDFEFTRAGAGTVSARLTAGSIAISPVPSTVILNTAQGRVGYLLFNDHVLTAENALVGAVQGLASQGIDDLVIDLRYNRGGYAFIASQLAFMVAGANRTASRIFERQQYSDKRLAESNGTASIMPFFSVKCVPDPARGFACTNSGEFLPELKLARLWVLAGPDTCSASEAIINGLRGVDVSVTLVGGTTCGKPYAFTAKDNCGISYFPIESKGVNAKGFGDYAAGFAPTCAAADDFDHALGDPAEAMLATALAHRAGGACPVPGSPAASASAPPSRLVPRPERSLKIDLPPGGMRGISR
jgi:carboxyl-terminal processing protease